MVFQDIDELEDDAIVHVLLERLGEQRIPRVKAIQDLLDSGAPISDIDLHYLTDIAEDFQQNMHYMEKHPELRKIMNQVVALYNEVSDQVVQNEAEAKPKTA